MTAAAEGGGMKREYGGDVTRAQFIRLTIALCLGTLVEWYDFTVYSQLANIITQLFFPSSNPSVAQLSFWGVYAVGFVSRPAGAVLFGHIGDSHGRRTTLLYSVLFITIPTLLIGCLPTFQHIGLAAPILMAVLRCTQGVAVGGEFGSAITYLFEMGPAGRKGMTASLGQLAIAPGIILGILVCQAVLYGCSHSQLLLWGWRVPFLVTVFTAPLAIIMRMHMPEPREFLANRQQMVLQRVASTAAHRVARTYSRQHSASPAGSPTSAGGGASQLLLLGRALSGKRSSELGAAAAAPGQSGGPLSPRLSSRQLSLKLQRSYSLTADAGCAAGPPAGAAQAPAPRSWRRSDSGGGGGAQQQQQQQLADVEQGGRAAGALAGHDRRLSGSMRQRSLVLVRQLEAGGGGAALPAECEQLFQEEVEEVAGRVKHHVPLAVLFRDHWQGLLLQFLLEANYGATFYTFFSWAPPYIEKTHHVPVRNTLWAILIAMVLFACCVVLTGRYIADSKVPKVWALLAVTGVVAVVSLPVLVCIEAGYAVGMWLLLPCMMGLAGVIGGLMTTIGPQIYPAAVRASGYNIGHNLTMSLFGGTSPLLISALATVLHPPTNAAGIIIIIAALITFCAGVGLIKVAPGTNAPCPAGAHLQHLEEQAQLKQQAQQEQQQAQQLKQQQQKQAEAPGVRLQQAEAV